MPRQFVPWQMILSLLKIVSLQKRKPSTHFSRYMKAEVYQNPHWKLKIISLFHTRIIIELPKQFPDVCFSFALFRSVVGPQNPLSFPNLLNSRVKLATSSPTFPRAWSCLLVFTWSSHRLPVIFFYCSDWLLSVLWFWLSTLNRFALCSRFELSTCRLTWNFVRFYNS